MKKKGKLDNNLVLVTGSGTGIGREIALEFAREGACVALHYSHSADGAESAVKEILSMGGKAKAFKADFQDVEQAKKLAIDAIGFLGGIDVVVNNAGITMTLEFEKVTPEQFDTVYNVNIRSPFFVTQTVLPTMLKRGKGAVINLTSIHGISAFAGSTVYGGTKGAIISYTRELAIELAPKNIRVNAIAPGEVAVENQFKLGLADLETVGKGIPCGFAGRPLDIAKVAVFLASEDSRYIIGQTIIVDGGTTSWMSFSEDFKQMPSMRLGVGYVAGL